MHDALIESYKFKKGGRSLAGVERRVSKNSSAGRQLLEWRSPLRTPEIIAASKPYEKIDFFSPTVRGYKQRMSSELEAYGFESVMTNKTIDRLRHHHFKHRLVMDDLKEIAELKQSRKIVGNETMETLNPYRASRLSRIRAEL
ncbi:hypothetical protein D3C76_1413880 [compost metagenome]